MVKGQSPHEVLLELARRQYATIRDPSVFGCWHVIEEAIARGWLTPSGRLSVAHTADEIAGGGSVGVEEYWIDTDYEGGDPTQAVVGLVDQNWRCSRAALVSQLRRLDQALNHGTDSILDPEPTPDEEEVVVPEPSAFVTALRDLLARTGSSTDSETLHHLHDQAEALLSRFTQEDEKVTPNELCAAFERLTAADRNVLTSALRSFADWADEPAAYGDAVDAAVQALDRTFGQWLTPGRRTEEQATRERIASSAREAIARRLPCTDDRPSDSG